VHHEQGRRRNGGMVHEHGNRRLFPIHGRSRGRGGAAGAPKISRGLIIAPRILSDMKGALRREAKHPVRCQHIAAEGNTDTGLMRIEKHVGQSPNATTRNHAHMIRGRRAAERKKGKIRVLLRAHKMPR
jgi:hypothetical protein